MGHRTDLGTPLSDKSKNLGACHQCRCALTPPYYQGLRTFSHSAARAPAVHRFVSQAAPSRAVTKRL
jgi:hypothetical protein